MKQLLFLLLFPCLALAQYPGNAGQKITLGEQTSADGLVYRGLAADTTRKPSVDTMAYILLDTNTNIIWQYKKVVNNAWTRVGGSISSGVTGVLPVANGGTGSATKNFVDLTNAQTVAGIKTFNANSLILKSLAATGNLTIAFKDANDNTKGSFGFASGANNVFQFSTSQQAVGNIRFNIWNSNENRIIFNIDTSFKIGFGNNIVPTELIDIGGNARIRAVGTASASNSALYVTNTGVLSTNASDVNKKHNIRNLPYGLSTINNLNPVAFEWNETDETDIGFIAQDIENVIPESVITNWDSELIFRQEKIIPVLVKAIQEQQALIKALEQRILILENK